MPQCAVAAISAANSNTYAGISPARRPTTGLVGLLGMRSRKRPNCLKVSHLGPMHRPNHHRKMAISPKHSCD